MSEKFRELLRKYPGFFEGRFTFKVETSYDSYVNRMGPRSITHMSEGAVVILENVYGREMGKIQVRLTLDDLPEFITDCVNYREGIQ